jgi:hypothetical protein
MRTHKVLAAGAAVLVLSLFFLAGDAAAGLREDADELVKSGAEKPDELTKAGAEFTKKNKIDNDSIKDVMDFLGKRDATSTAWGVGDKPGAIKPDNIEFKIKDLQRKALDGKQLEKEAAALVEMANRTAAVGSIALASPPQRDMPDKTIKDWKKFSEEMIKSSREFAKAVKTNDPDAVQKAARKLDTSCADCHAVFR